MKKGPKVKQIVIVLFLSGAVARSAAAADGPELLRLFKTADAMGSTYSVELYGYEPAKLTEAADAALEEAQRLDGLLSNYKPESEWSRINQHAAEGPMRISPEMFRLLAACVEYSIEGEGAFDITVGPLMKVWGFYKGTGHLPHGAEVRGALDTVGYKNILLDAKNHTVRFAREGVEMDPGGVGKGYAVDKIAAILKEDGIRSALISGGGSSIYAIGTPPGETGWKVTIKDPKDQSKAAATVSLKDESLSTSGNYEKFFWAEGKLYSHI